MGDPADENRSFLRQYRTNELLRWRMNSMSDAMADCEGLTSRKLIKLQAANGRKGIAYAADELYGSALAVD